MNRKFTSLLPAKALVVLLALHSCVNNVSAQNPNQQQRPGLPPIPINGDTHILFQDIFPRLLAEKKHRMKRDSFNAGWYWSL